MVASTGQASAVSRLDRRKARTRQALIDAAVRLIAAGRGERASIQEITEQADVGFGSFYNHFPSKEELFLAASSDVLERWGQMIDQACAAISDPAEVFAVSFRISARLGWTHPEIARFLLGAGLDLLDAPNGLAPRARRDIKAAQAAGRFYHRQRRDRGGRGRGGPARAALAAPTSPRPDRRGLCRPTHRGDPSSSGYHRSRSKPTGNAASPSHRRLVAPPRTPALGSAARAEAATPIVPTRSGETQRDRQQSTHR
jgi:AcrR family transcriptional regulator